MTKEIIIWIWLFALWYFIAWIIYNLYLFIKEIVKFMRKIYLNYKLRKDEM